MWGKEVDGKGTAIIHLYLFHNEGDRTYKKTLCGQRETFGEIEHQTGRVCKRCLWAAKYAGLLTPEAGPT